MNTIYDNGHCIQTSSNKIIIDGQTIPQKLLKSGPYLSTNFDGKSCTIGGNKIKFTRKGLLVNGVLLDSELKETKEIGLLTLIEKENQTAKKYILSTDKNDIIDKNGTQLFRIIAIEDIKDSNGNILVKKGIKGGFVESRHNLSEKGSCWIYDDACAFEASTVNDNAYLSGKASSSGNVKLYNSSSLKDNAKAHGNATFYDNSSASGNSKIYGNVSLHNNSSASGNSEIYGNVRLRDNVLVSGYVALHGNNIYTGNTQILSNKDIPNEEYSGNSNAIQRGLFNFSSDGKKAKMKNKIKMKNGNKVNLSNVKNVVVDNSTIYETDGNNNTTIIRNGNIICSANNSINITSSGRGNTSGDIINSGNGSINITGTVGGSIKNKSKLKINIFNRLKNKSSQTDEEQE